MNFDLTKEIPLDAKSYRNYRIFQTATYLIAVAIGLYLAYLVIFPTEYFLFMFHSPNSTRNNIISPRNNEAIYTEKGLVGQNSNLLFDAAIFGNYSRTQVNFLLDKKNTGIGNNKVEIRKSHQAFFYPEGIPLGFKDGSLLKNKNNYYLISEGKARRFSNLNTAQALGFSPEAFKEISEEDLSYNEKGEEINNTSSYPNDSLFIINDAYYILKDQKLQKFISPNAYLSHYDSNQAIPKDESFLRSYPLENSSLGFSDGTPVSYGISVYIVSSGKINPVNNPTTFTSMGYDWEDVIAVSGDEISLYEKEKLFTLDSPHPDGTIMVTKENNKWYLIEQGQKRSIPSENIARSWLKRNPILVSEGSLVTKEECRLSANGENDDYSIYSCLVPIEKFENLIGRAYEFKFVSDKDIVLEEIRVNFEMAVNWKNFKVTARDMINRIRGNYVPQTSATIQ